MQDNRVMFLVVRVVHKFGFSFVINIKPNKQRPVEKVHAVIKGRVFDRNSMFPLSIIGSFKGLYPLCAGKQHSVVSRTFHTRPYTLKIPLR